MTTDDRILAALISAGVPETIRTRDELNAAITAAMTVIDVTNHDWHGFPRDLDVPRSWWAGDVAHSADVF